MRRYASGATIQVLLFAILAIQVKRRCPVMHTYLEVIQVRGKQLYRVYFILKTIVLPRQARDKHRENSVQTYRFLAAALGRRPAQGNHVQTPPFFPNFLIKKNR